MKKNLKMTPEGTKDFLFAECSAMDSGKAALLQGSTVMVAPFWK